MSASRHHQRLWAGGRRRSVGPRLWLLASLIALFPVVQVQAVTSPIDSLRSRPSAGKVIGAVHDSVANAPIIGAIVQLVSADTLVPFGRTAVSDRVGRFAFDSVPSGRYVIGFYHPVLDSLALEPMLRAVTVANGETVLANLAVPSPARLRAMFCLGVAGRVAAPLVMGMVLDARTGTPAAGVTVSVEWVEVTLGKGGIRQRAPRRVATTRSDGMYMLCDVPSPGTLMLAASRGADSTDFVDLEVPATGFLRRTLHLGTARTVVVRDSAATSDSSRSAVRRQHVGTGKLIGTVTSAVNGQPLVGAQVGIANGPQTRTNARGQWTLSEAPTGTRIVHTRAVGYYPSRQSVDVVAGTPPLSTALVTFKSVMDTMKVIANYDRFANLAGFRERQRSGLGRFLTQDDVARRQPLVTSELLRTVAGVFLDRTMSVDETILMRGTFEDRCVPVIFINTMRMDNLTAVDLDAFIRPSEILGVEVYSATQVPAQFQPGLNGCGSIVFWTK